MTVAQLKAFLVNIPDTHKVEFEFDTLCCSALVEHIKIFIYSDRIILSEDDGAK